MKLKLIWNGKIMSRVNGMLRKPLVFVGLALILTRPASGATAAEVDLALKRGIDALYAKQQDGNWEVLPSPRMPWWHDAVDSGQWGGLTGIATFALLAAEEDPQDPRIAKAVDFLQTAKLRGTYAVSMRAQVWPFMAKVRNVRPFARQDLQLLLGGVKTKGPARGQWYYYVDEPSDQRSDHSASQFAMLGVWACEEAGVEVPTSFWRVEDEVWRHDQLPGGAWNYVFDAQNFWKDPLVSMTLAGVASLYLSQEKLVTVASRCTPMPADKAIDCGIQYIADHYPSDWDNCPPGTYIPTVGKRQLYVLFGISRLGLASGRRYIGTHDWFKDGADYLVKTQQADGSWGDTWETAFGVLFLARGHAPVAFSKLEYDTGKNPPVQDWNVRPRDVANLADWMGKSLERRISWQVVDIKSDSDDWLDAPVLYVSGDDELKFSADQAAKLKRFVENGGLILGNADCGNGKFSASFRKHGQQMFPAYEWADLPATSPIYTREQFVRTKWKSKPRVLALGNGVRELMLLCSDADLGRTYAVQDDRSKPEAFQFGVDLREYMAGLDLHHRGDSIFVLPDPAIGATRTLKVARLKYRGNWDPEPGGWQRLAAIVHNQNKLEVSIEPVELGKALSGYSVAHLTGTVPITLTAAQKSALLDYVNGGGTLLVDAAGGSTEFAAAMQPQIQNLFADPMTVIPPEAPLYRQGDSPMQSFLYTRFARSTLGTLRAPRLKAITIKGRPAVFFSADDLSMGMVGQPVDGVIGYAPDTATEIVRRIVLASAPVTQPAKPN